MYSVIIKSLEVGHPDDDRRTRAIGQLGVLPDTATTVNQSYVRGPYRKQNRTKKIKCNKQ